MSQRPSYNDHDEFATSRLATLRTTRSLPAAPRKSAGLIAVLTLIIVFGAAFGGSYYALAHSSFGQSYLGFGTTGVIPTWTAPPAGTALPTATTGPVSLQYYGASLQGMQHATGVNTNNQVATNSPWPQASGNYCSLATTQGMINYIEWANNQTEKFLTRASEGPATYTSTPGDPNLQQAGQLLYDMDHTLAANLAPGLKVVSSGRNRKPFTLANISHDSGMDPRAVAVTVAYETNAIHPYHMHIFHNAPGDVAKHIAQVTAKYQEPLMLMMNRGEHSVLIAGVWAYGNPATDPQAIIDSFAVYSPWDQNWGYFLDGTYFERVPLDQFVGGTSRDGATWLARPYASNNGYDPDPYMGPYQAGVDPYTGATANPTAHFWIGNIVTIERDDHNDNTPDNAYNENDQLMTGP